MSIAVSAPIAAWPWRRRGLCLFAALSLAAALMLAGGLAGPLRAAPLQCALCLAAAGAAARRALQKPNAHHIDVSGLGQIRLTVQPSGEAACASQPVELAPGSTLWPRLLVLHLGAPQQACAVLLVAPDGMAPGQFRRLAVAVRSIAGGAAGGEKNH